MLILPISHASVLPSQHHHLFYTVVQGAAEVERQVVVAVGMGPAAEADNVEEVGQIVAGLAGQRAEEVHEKAERVSGSWVSALAGVVQFQRDEVVVLAAGLVVRCKNLEHWVRSCSHPRLILQLLASWELSYPR